MKLFNNTQSGRSMVEMLGVLAIIGVLSVGGIAGYSKAMFKYKINQTMDFISQVVANIVALDGKNLGFLETAQDLISSGIVPNCDVNYVNVYGQKGYSCPVPLGEIGLDSYSDEYTGTAGITLNVRFTNNPVESCVAFFNSEIYKHVPEHFWHLNDGNAAIAVNPDDYGGIILYAKSERHLSNGMSKSVLTAADIANACGLCKDVNYCAIMWVMELNL